MKKLLAFILAAVMTASLCACGSSKGGAEGSTSAKGSSAAGEAVAASDIKVRQRAADFLTCITSLPESMNPVIYPVLLLV